VNIQQQYQKAVKDRDNRIGDMKWGVVTHGELAIGEEFYFGTSSSPRAGDVIDLRANRRFPGGYWYGKAKIVSNDAGCCKARRVS
jgi:hypothetical protein